MPLDEIALRKPDFQEGQRVRLGDGQEWSIPSCRVRIVPRCGEDGRFTLGMKPGLSLGPEFEHWFDVLTGAAQASDYEELEAQFGAAAMLLGLNYTLSIGNLESLLYHEFGDPESSDRWAEIAGAIRGLGPKPTPAT